MLGYTGNNHTHSVRTNWIMGTAVRTSQRAAVPGLSASDLAEFLGFGSFITPGETASLGQFMDTAIEMLAKYTGYEPADVTYTISYDRHPRALRYTGGIAGQSELAEWISLPRRIVKSVDEVRSSGFVITDYEQDLSSNPARIGLTSYSVSVDYPRFSEIEIDLTVGPDATLGVDPRFVTAALMLSSYMYNKRGCDVSGAMTMSGAKALVKGMRVAVGGL